MKDDNQKEFLYNDLSWEIGSYIMNNNREHIKYIAEFLNNNNMSSAHRMCRLLGHDIINELKRLGVEIKRSEKS